jgi:hypothetical protein
LGLTVCLLGFAVLGLPGIGLRSQSSGSTLIQDAAPNDVQSVVRVIDDPAFATRWLLVRGNHPGGPGAFVRRLSPGVADPASGKKKADTPDAFTTVIHAGDKLILEAHTGTVDFRLEAIALSAARLGAPFQARLKFGGRIVRVVAFAPGRATLATKPEGWTR